MKLIKKISLLIILLTSANLYCQNVWEVYDQMDYPVARGEMVVINDVIYILGGYSDSTQCNVTVIQKYNPILTGVWKDFGDMLLQRSGFVAGSYLGNVYYFGGVNSLLPNADAIEKWDLNQTGQAYYNNVNFTRIYAAGNLQSNKFYIIGGNPTTTAAYLPYIVSYDLQTNSIEVLENSIYNNRALPEHQMSAVMSNSIFIFGGVINGLSQNIYKFDLTTKTLELLPVQLLQLRAAGAAVAVPSVGKIYIIGGFNESNNSLSSVEVLRITDTGYEISSGTSLNYARSACMAAHTSDAIYVMGGFNENGIVVRDVERLFFGSTTDADDSENEIISDFSLIQNYPNPFNSTTNITVKLNKESDITLDIYSTTGEKIKNITTGRYNAGSYNFQWHGTDSAGNSAPSGIYIYRIISGSFSYSKKMILLK